LKKLIIGCMLTCLMIFGSLSIYAAPGKFYGGYGKSHEKIDDHEREDGRYIVHRTAMVVFAAQRSAEQGHHFLGFTQVIAHQQRAQELYMQGSYREAIFHSLRARELAIQIIGENHGRCEREFFRDEREENYYHSAPRDNELDMKLDMKKMGKDDEVAHIRFYLDINK
jgi:hypothetical protein